MTTERIFQILAVALAGVAAYFLWQGDTDKLFVAAVLGACSFFLSIRFQFKERMLQREDAAASEAEMQEESSDQSNPDDTQPVINDPSS
jgi:hypothetical protein